MTPAALTIAPSANVPARATIVPPAATAYGTSNRRHENPHRHQSMTLGPSLSTRRGAPWARTRLESPDGVLFTRTADGGTYRPARCWTTGSALAANVVRAPE